MSKMTIHTAKAPKAIGPYSQAVSHASGEMIFFSGQVSLDPETQEMTGTNATEQTRRALENLSAVAKAAGVSLDNIVKTTIYVTSMNDFADVNQVYSEFFNEPYPARATIEVARLPKDGLVEIDAIAIKV